MLVLGRGRVRARGVLERGQRVPAGHTVVVGVPQTVVGQQATQTVAIKNAAKSGGTLTIESTGIAGLDAGMFADGFDDATSVALAPGQSTTITVVFSPTAAGSRSATLAGTTRGAATWASRCRARR